MKKFIKKAKRKIRHLNLNPKVIGILSVFVIALGVFTFNTVFAEDVQFQMIPINGSGDTTVHTDPYSRPTQEEYDEGEFQYVTLKVGFDMPTAKQWDTIAVNVEYDKNVFDEDNVDYTKVLKRWNGNALSNSAKLDLSGVGENGRYSFLVSKLDDTKTYSGGVWIAELLLPIRPDAPGGTTDIRFTAEIDGEPMTYVSLDGENYTQTLTDTQVVIGVPVDESSIGVSPTSLSLDINTNREATIEPVYQPEGANQPPMDLGFLPSDPSIATVDSLTGEVTAVAPGNTSILVSLFGHNITVPVEVKAGLISIGLNESDQAVSLEKGQTHDYTVINNPSNTTDTVEYVWSSSNTSAVTVDNSGKITAVGGGQSTITVTAKVNGQLTTKNASSLVTVNVPLESVTGTPSQINLKRGITGQSDATITVGYVPSDTTVDRTVSYSINPSEGVATVSDTGVVTAVGKGDATVTGRVGSKSFEVRVHVDVPILTFGITPTTVDLYDGQHQQLTTEFNPPAEQSSENTNIRWVSSNESVATVNSSGYVDAVGVGTATITAYTGDLVSGVERLSSTSTIRVYTPIEGITMSENDFTLYTNDNSAKTKTLSVTINPEGSGTPADRTVSWESDNNATATVDQNGKVTAVGNGNATITARVGNKTATADVKVETKVESFIITNSTDITIEKGDSHSITYTITPNTATHQTVSWVSDNEERATVSPSGIITANGNGNTTIRGTVDGKEVTVTVHVITSAENVIIQEGSSIDLEKNKYTTLHATIEPSDSTDNIIWSSSDDSTVSVDQTGKITAHKSGSATITAKAGPVSKTITVNVVIKATGVEITDSDFILNQGNYKTIAKSVQPEDTTDTITWTSNNESVATVDSNGKVTAVSTGEANITATINGHSDSVKVTVVLPADSIRINGDNPLVLQKGNNSTILTTTVTPAGATGTVNWTSSNTDVATIDANGKINAKATGTTTITASLGNVSHTITVNVILSATGIEITEGASTTINKNDNKTLHAQLNPSDSTDSVVWSSSDSTTVSVDQNGKITGKKAGRATITATVQHNNGLQSATPGLSQAGEIQDTITVDVLVPTTSISITDGETINMIKGQERTLAATVQPADSTDTITWESSDTSKATVDQNGKVKAMGTGSVTITVRAGNKSDTITIGISYPATSVEINGAETRTIHRGNNETLTATVQPSGSTDGLTWVSSKPGVASVDATTGKVTANAIGSAVITARAGDKTDTVTINVDAPITSFTSDETNISIVKGKTKSLTYTITPSDTTDNKTITWVSNDTSKVTVDNTGKITAKGQGSTTVVATLGSRSITYNVTVTIIPVSGITLNKDTLTVRKGDSDGSLKYTITPEDTTEDKTVTWSSSDPTVATVDQTGKVTAIKAGQTDITVRNGTYSDSARVTVIEIPATGINITNSDDTIEIGDTYKINVVAEPRNTTDVLNFRYTSSDETIATVDENGKVTAKKSGKVTITVQTENGAFEDTIELNVVVPSVVPNPNTGVKSVYVYLLSSIISLFGTIIIAKKRFN